MLESLKVINASGGKAPTIAIQIESPALEEPICLVSDFVERELFDHANVERKFRASGLKISLPERNTSGFSDLTFQIADVSGETYGYAQQVVNSSDVAQLWLLEYLPGAKKPCYTLRLSITQIMVEIDKATVTAGWHDTLNRKFPYLRYTAIKFPGLRYV